MNILKKYFAKQFLKELTQTNPKENELNRMIYQLINNDLPITLGEKQVDYIRKGFTYNDLIYSIITTKQDVGKTVDWLMNKIVDEKAYKGYKYHMKAFSKNVNPQQNLSKAIQYRKKALEEVTDGPMVALLDQVNSTQSIKDITAEYLGWMDLMGNFYLYGLRRNDGKTFQSVHVAPSHEVEIVAGTWYDPVKGYKVKTYLDNEIIDREKMLHIKTWNPDFTYDGRHLYGVSPLKAGARILQLDNIGIDTSAANFKNSGVRGIIHQAVHKEGYTGTLSPEQADQLRKKVEAYSGTSKSGGLAATNAPIAFTKIGDTPVDLGIYTAMDKNMVRLCNLLKVPPELFIPGTKFNNKAEARKNMITTGILPSLDILKDNLNRWLIAPYNDGKNRYHLDYDLFSIVELQEDLSKIADMYRGVDWVSMNEKRAAMNYGQIESDDNGLADELFIDPMKIPLSSYNESTDAEIDEMQKEYRRLINKVRDK